MGRKCRHLLPGRLDNGVGYRLWWVYEVGEIRDMVPAMGGFVGFNAG